MCGIAGFAGWTPDGGSAEASETVRAMCDAIAHRGPDDDGYFVAPGIALGMRRLSIIDVSGGQQPIANEDGTVQVVFNGEIYNHHELRHELVARGHSFRTRSATEPIVHLYDERGADFVGRMKGMFAIALWDARQRRLVLARDRAGIKPLSYWQTADGLAFGSELRSLLTLPRFHRRLDERGIAAFLSLGYVPDPLTAFDGVAKLPPGHVLVWSADRPGDAAVRRYWHPVAAESTALTETDAADQLRVLLADAVTSHLESEVPLGAFLSGGLDSSTVVALMREAAIVPRTFAIGFGESAFNEAPHARRVAESLGASHTDLVVSPAADRLVDGLVSIFDDQFGDLLADAFAEAGARDFVSQMMLVDVATYLPGDILTKVDRASMAVSLEARVPLLDHPLVEFALSLPATFKIRDGTGKRVFRRAIRELVPPTVLDHPKLGFAVPLADWFRGPLRHRLDQLARPERLYTYIDRRALQRLAREHLLRRRDHSVALWRALVLELWLGHLDAGRLARPISRSLVDA